MALVSSTMFLGLGTWKVSAWTIDAIHGLEYATAVTELQPSFGLENIIRRSGPNLAQITAPLN